MFSHLESPIGMFSISLVTLCYSNVSQPRTVSPSIMSFDSQGIEQIPLKETLCTLHSPPIESILMLITDGSSSPLVVNGPNAVTL